MCLVFAVRHRKESHHCEDRQRSAWTETCTHASSDSFPSLASVSCPSRICTPGSDNQSICTSFREQNQQAVSPPVIHTFPYVTGAEACALKAACQIQGLGGSRNASSTLAEFKKKTQNPPGHPNPGEHIQTGSCSRDVSGGCSRVVL